MDFFGVGGGQLKRRNSKGRSGYIFWLILQKTFAAFSHWKLKVAQIWSTHQSKALIFYFGMKKFGVGFLKILWETDKVHFTSLNLVCVYTHPKFQKMKFTLSVFAKFSKLKLKIFLCQNRKSELSIDGLIISVPLLTFSVRKRQKFFVKWVKNCTLSALLNFASLLLSLYF